MRSTCLFLLLAAVSLSAQSYNLSGTVLAADSGAPIPGAAVIAIQKTVTSSQQPATYKVASGTDGSYSMPVAAGQYTLCVHATGVYLNPCQWGGATVVRVIADTAVPALRLTKGARFWVRVHDRQKLIGAVEAAGSPALSVLLTDSSGTQRPLPVIYDDGNVRDFGDVLPIGVPMKVTVNSTALQVTNAAGGSAQTIPFQVAALPAASAQASRMFPSPDATVLHVQITGRN